LLAGDEIPADAPAANDWRRAKYVDSVYRVGPKQQQNENYKLRKDLIHAYIYMVPHTIRLHLLYE